MIPKDLGPAHLPLHHRALYRPSTPQFCLLASLLTHLTSAPLVLSIVAPPSFGGRLSPRPAHRHGPRLRSSASSPLKLRTVLGVILSSPLAILPQEPSSFPAYTTSSAYLAPPMSPLPHFRGAWMVRVFLAELQSTMSFALPQDITGQQKEVLLSPGGCLWCLTQ